MKWFKHFSSASHDEFLEAVIEDFGLEGYARWWLILETIAAQMDHTNRCTVTYSWTKWQTILKGKRNKLETFLKRLENENKITLKQIENKLEIGCPKLLNLRDNYTKHLQGDSQQTLPATAQQEVEVEVEEEVESQAPSSKKKTYTDDDMKLANFMRGRIKKMLPKSKEPNLDGWANEMRLMREQDNRDVKEIQNTFIWANMDNFWRSNILSPAKLRKQFDSLTAKMASENIDGKSTINWDSTDWGSRFTADQPTLSGTENDLPRLA